jgi:hypothetical protein
MNNRPKLTLTRKDPGFALCLMCGGPAVWFAEYEPVDLTLCDTCYETAMRDDEPDVFDKAVTALRQRGSLPSLTAIVRRNDNSDLPMWHPS